MTYTQGVLLAFFAAIAVFAALSCAARLQSAGTAERALAASILWLGIFCVPVHVLGWLNVLTRLNLAIALAVVTAAMLVLAWFPTRRARMMAGIIAQTARLPWDAFAEAWRERSVAFVGLIACALILMWTAWLSYLAPSSSWDGLMYHEAIVGFSIQNHGFRWVEVPQGVLEQVNGFPRTCEYLALTAALFDGKRFMDLVPTVVSPIAILAFYVAMRRFMKDRSVTIALACGLYLVPAIVLELRSTYVDIEYALCFAACCHFVTRPKMDLAHAWLCVLAIGLLGGLKVTGLLLAPPLLALWFLRASATGFEQRRKAYLPTVLLGTVAIVALGFVTYLRNWFEKKNVVWPSDLNIAALDIHWRGPFPVSNMQHAASDVWKDLFDLPSPSEQFADSRDNGYGNATTAIMLPLAVIAIFALLFRVIKQGLSGLFRASSGASKNDVFLLYLTFATGLAFSQSPAFWWARLNLHVVVIGYMLVAWLLGEGRWRRLAEGFAGALIVMGLVTLHWATPKWDVGYDAMRALMRESATERIAHPLGVLIMPQATARAREAELHAGDVVAFTHHPFIGTLWNEHYTNRVVWVAYHGEATFLRDLGRARAKWVVVDHASPEASVLRRHRESWEEVGHATALNNETTAFRRVSRPMLAPSAPTPPTIPAGVRAAAAQPAPARPDAQVPSPADSPRGLQIRREPSHAPSPRIPPVMPALAMPAGRANTPPGHP